MKLEIEDKLHIHKWLPQGTPCGVIQIIHGLGEHAKRYERFASFLSNSGFLVVASDHDGHGLSVKEGKRLGEISGTFSDFVSDEIQITKELHGMYPDVPLYVFAHSMGSFIGQGHLQANLKEVHGYILSGSGWPKGLWAAKVLTSIIGLGRKNQASPLLKKLLTRGFNKKFSEEKNPYSWLSSDLDVGRVFSEDSLCDFPYSIIFYKTFIAYLANLYKKNNFTKANRQIPILFISGEMDPLGDYGESITKLHNYYVKKLKFENTFLKLYPEARHELLNEPIYPTVQSDILKFLLK